MAGAGVMYLTSDGQQWCTWSIACPSNSAGEKAGSKRPRNCCFLGSDALVERKQSPLSSRGEPASLPRAAGGSRGALKMSAERERGSSTTKLEHASTQGVVAKTANVPRELLQRVDSPQACNQFRPPCYCETDTRNSERMLQRI